MRILSPILLYAFLFQNTFAYEIVDNFSGATFFDKWDFYGHWDNLTLGDVWWLNRGDRPEAGFHQRCWERGN